MAQVAACLAPQLVIDDESEDEAIVDRSPVVAPVAQGLVRPVAMKVKAQHPVVAKPFMSRPIPKRATEKFYDEAYRQGIPAYAVNAAIMESHDWHRKWTQQDEEGHTMPHDENDNRPTGALPQQYAYQAPLPDMVMERMAGARNPSPEWESESESPNNNVAVERKRSRFEPQVVEPLFVSDNEIGPAAKRPVPIRPSAPALDDDEDDDDEPQQPPANMLLRPVALRVPRPVIAQMPSSSVMSMPKFISTDEASCSKMSAITQGSGLSEVSNSKGNDHGYDFHTDAPQVQSMLVEDDEHDTLGRAAHDSLEESLVERRDELLKALAISGGDAQADTFAKSIAPLAQVFEEQDVDTRQLEEDSDQSGVHGTWLTLTKPTFFGNLGENDAGDPMYTLGRMTFDMFSPTNLVCSLQGNFNSIEIVGDEQRGSMLKAGLVPKGLREEVENRDVVLRTYNIITAFTIEPSLAEFPNAPNKDVRRPIRGIMTTYGYTLPDPDVPNRHSIWITGGRIEPNSDPADVREWDRLFKLHPPKHGLAEQAKLLAVKLLMGATIPDKVNEDGSMDYSFTRPLGGHGVAYVDVLYLDDSLRVVRGHRGTFFVFSRIQQE